MLFLNVCFVLHHFLALASSLNPHIAGVFTVSSIIILDSVADLVPVLILDTPFPKFSTFHQFKMRASVIILGFLATLTVALPEAYPKAEIACQSVSLLDE